MILSWQQIPSTVVSDILCKNHADGVVIDTEHGSFNPETLYACIQVVTLNNKKCFVRLTEINKIAIRQCLDAGCDGLIFSTIESLKEANEVKKYCLYPKHGGLRGLGLVRENTWGLKDLVSEPPTLVAQIETVSGVRNIRPIWESEIFDFCMIGPYDLSASIGKAGDFNSKEFKESIESVKKIVPLKRMAVHIPTNVKNEKKKYEGYGIMALGMDTMFLISGNKLIDEM